MTRNDPPALRARNLLPWIQDLHSAGRYDQVVIHTARALEDDPTNSDLHYFRGLALITLRRTQEAKAHVDFVLHNEPSEPRSYHLQALYYHFTGKPRLAAEAIQTALDRDPEWAVYHYVASFIAAAAGKFKKAKDHITTALELDPRDTDYIRFAVELQSIAETDISEAWDHISKLIAALAINPNDAQLHISIGDIYLDKLERPEQAEVHFREALRLDPNDRNAQRALFKAVGQQRFIYRVLSIPARAATWAALTFKSLARKAPIGLVMVFLFCWHGLIIFGIWLAAATLLFRPAATVYEWLFINENRAGAAAPAFALRGKKLLQSWPATVRFSLFLTLASIFWIVLTCLLTDSLQLSLLILTTFITLHFLLTALSIASKRTQGWFALRKARRRLPNLVQ